MATCQALIKRALRMLGELPAGREAPANEASDAMLALQGLYKHLIATGTLGRLRDVLISADYTAGENERVIVTSGTPTITLPTTIAETECACGGPYDYGFSTGTDTRAVRDRSVVVEAGTSPKFYIYDADLAAWVRIDTIVLTDQAPFTQKLETGMAALLALHIASEYRDSPPTVTVSAGAGQCMAALTQKPDSAATVVPAEFY